MHADAVAGADLGTLLTDLLHEHDTLELLDRVLHAAITLTSAVSAAILVPTSERGLQVLAATSETTRDLELFQVMTGEGPAVDCLGSRATVLAPSIGTMHERWPGFTAAARAVGVDSVLSLHMHPHGTSVGALNVFDPTGLPSTLDGDNGDGDDNGDGCTGARIRGAQQLADLSVLALALTGRPELTVDLLVRRTLDRRVLLEQAKGVVAEWSGLSPHESGRLILGHARSRGLRLGDVAADLVALRVDPAEFLVARSAPS